MFRRFSIITFTLLTLLALPVFAEDKPSGVERSQTVSLNLAMHVADSDYQIVELYGTRTGLPDTLLYTVTNTIRHKSGSDELDPDIALDEFGKALPGIVQHVDDVDIKCTVSSNDTDTVLHTSPNRCVDTYTTSEIDALHKGEPKATTLYLRYDILPAADVGYWRYQDESSSKKKNVYDGYYVKQRDEIHDKRNSTIKSNVSKTVVMLNLLDEGGSAHHLNIDNTTGVMSRSKLIQLVPNLYPATTSLTDLDQVYWFCYTEDSEQSDTLQKQIDLVKKVDKTACLPTEPTLKSWMNAQEKSWKQIASTHQLNYTCNEKGIDTVYFYCMVHHRYMNKWLMSDIVRISYSTEALLYVNQLPEYEVINTQLIQEGGGIFEDISNGIYTTSANKISGLKITKTDTGEAPNSTLYVHPGTHVYSGQVVLEGKLLNCTLQITGIPNTFKAEQIKFPKLGEYWGATAGHGENKLLSPEYFHYTYGTHTIPDDTFDIVCTPVNDYIHENNTLVNVNIIHKLTKISSAAKFTAKANYADVDTTNDATSILSISLRKTGDPVLTNAQVIDNNITPIRSSLKCIATDYTGKKIDVTDIALYNTRRSGKFAIITATYAQCSDSITVRVTD